ncbi:MAG: carboxylating nicotinate-nucleotide diphosphorylase [Bacteroidota bacterium]
MKIENFIDQALAEDIGSGDHTTLSCVPAHATGRARLLVKDNGIIAGVKMAEMIFNRYDPELKFSLEIPDGSPIKPKDIVFTVEGKSRSILTTERTVLNCMQRMSGIATYTRVCSDLLKGTKARLLDTRKTTPNSRVMEKWAVLIGGGMNHRFGLYDMVMIKDNHADFAGGITKAVHATQAYLQEKNLNLKIEVEARNLDEVKEIIAVGGVHRILLDNFDNDTLRKAVTIIDGKSETEASGGITKSNLHDVAQTGVDFISMGALTHQIKSLDLSLKAY